MNELTDAVWPIIHSLLTPELVGAVILTLAATHTLKIVAEHWMDSVTDTASRWRAFCSVASVLIGALAGTLAWIGTEASWYIVPAVAFGSGPAWRLAQTVFPARMARAFMTATDRKYRMADEPKGKQ